MGQQIRKVTKRRRRIEYLKRKKEQSKLNSNAPIRPASYKMLSACMRPAGEDETFFYFEKTV